jgi:hypothetical protein
MEPSTIQLIHKVVGIGSIVGAGLGVCATLYAVMKCFQSSEPTDNEPEFRKFFFLFSSISFIYNLGLGSIGLALFFARPIAWWIFLIILLIPWVFASWLGQLWRNPDYGETLGAATGIGNIGMAIPSMLLLPIWGPMALWIAS